MGFLANDVRREMTVANKLGVAPGSFAIGTLEELEISPQVYNCSEDELVDALSTELLALAELGDCAPAHNNDAADFASMIEDLLSATTEEEYDAALSCYGSLGEKKSVRRFVAYKKAQLSA